MIATGHLIIGAQPTPSAPESSSGRSPNGRMYFFESHRLFFLALREQRIELVFKHVVVEVIVKIVAGLH